MITTRLRSLLSLFIDLGMAIIAFFLGMRIILELFQANHATPFVAWIYGASDYLIYPFAGLFPNYQVSNFGYLDLVALITLLAYSIIGYLILGVIRAFLRPTEYVASTPHEHVV